MSSAIVLDQQKKDRSLEDSDDDGIGRGIVGQWIRLQRKHIYYYAINMTAGRTQKRNVTIIKADRSTEDDYVWWW